MAENTKIEWADHTFNPWEGCQKVGPGCDNCYAEARDQRFTGGKHWGPGAPRRRTSAANWRKPYAWNNALFRVGSGEKPREFVFCASLADVFDNEVPTHWRTELLDMIRSTKNLVWLLLTKRIGNVQRLFDEANGVNLGWPPNAWLGITVVNQEEADRDIPKLLATKAALQIPRVFLSCEPLLRPIDLREIDLDGFRSIFPLTGTVACEDEDGEPTPDIPGIDWVIVGGESGPNARPMHPDWARGLRDQCESAGVPFLFKQWGEWAPVRGTSLAKSDRSAPHPDLSVAWPDGHVGGGTYAQNGGVGQTLYRIGKAKAGRRLDGVEHNGRPPP